MLGHDFGRTPMGITQVAASLRCCGDEERASACICDPALLELDVHDVRCPGHGLVAFARAATAGAVR